MNDQSHRPGLVRRLLGGIFDLVPGPPGEERRLDAELDGIERLQPDEQRARMRVWRARFRRGRGDGNG